MNTKELKILIKEIVQSELQSDARGGGIQSNQKGMGMWHDEKPFYHTSRGEGDDLWHSGGEEKKGETGETKQTPENFPSSKEERPSGQATFDMKVQDEVDNSFPETKTNLV